MIKIKLRVCICSLSQQKHTAVKMLGLVTVMCIVEVYVDLHQCVDYSV